MTSGDARMRPSRTRDPIAVFADVAKDGQKLLRLELDLARQETIEKISPAARSTALMVGGGVLALLGGTYLLQAIVRLIATRVPSWFASLIFGGALMVGGAGLALLGTRRLRNLDLAPRKTINSLREDREWLLRQIRSISR